MNFWPLTHHKLCIFYVMIILTMTKGASESQKGGCLKKVAIQRVSHFEMNHRWRKVTKKYIHPSSKLFRNTVCSTFKKHVYLFSELFLRHDPLEQDFVFQDFFFFFLKSAKKYKCIFHSEILLFWIFRFHRHFFWEKVVCGIYSQNFHASNI